MKWEGRKRVILAMSLSDDERIAVENQNGVHLEEDITPYACGVDASEQINDQISADPRLYE